MRPSPLAPTFGAGLAGPAAALAAPVAPAQAHAQAVTRGRTSGVCVARGRGVPSAVAPMARSPEWVAPTPRRRASDPVAASPEAIQKGRALYRKHCAALPRRQGQGRRARERYGGKPAEDLTSPALQANADRRRDLLEDHDRPPDGART